MLIELIKPGVFAYDIGANIGTCTERLIHGGCRVLAVEPQLEMCDHMRELFHGNDNVTVLQSGVSNVCGTQILFVNSQNTLSTMSNEWMKSSRFNKFVWNTQINVPVVTLDALIDEYGMPDYIKIDVEGWEHKVIAGLTVKVPCVSFEFVAEFPQRTVECMNMLKEKGYTEFQIPGFTGWVSFDDTMLEVKRLCSIDSKMWGDLYAR